MNPPDLSRPAKPRNERIGGAPPRRADLATMIMATGIVLLAGFMALGELDRRDKEERARVRDEAVLTELRAEFEGHRQREASHICASFLNQAGIEATLLKIARSREIPTPPPRVVLTPKIRASCTDSGIGVPPWVASVSTEDGEEMKP